MYGLFPALLYHTKDKAFIEKMCLSENSNEFHSNVYTISSKFSENAQNGTATYACFHLLLFWEHWEERKLRHGVTSYGWVSLPHDNRLTCRQKWWGPDCWSSFRSLVYLCSQLFQHSRCHEKEMAKKIDYVHIHCSGQRDVDYFITTTFQTDLVLQITS